LPILYSVKMTSPGVPKGFAGQLKRVLFTSKKGKNIKYIFLLALNFFSFILFY